MCAKGLPPGQMSLAAFDVATRALQEEFIHGFREEALAVTSEFRERLSPILGGTLGAAWVLGLRPGRWKWSGVYFNEPASLRSGCWECLDHWCDAFPGKLKAFVADLCELGHRIDTATKELEEICILISNVESRNWLACFCGDGSPADPDWRAPGWLLDWPAELGVGALRASTSNGRLDDDQTRDVCKRIQDRVGEFLVSAKDTALNHARILTAKENHWILRELTEVAAQQEQTVKIPAKKRDLASYFDAANLTDKQREVISLRLEYGMSVSEIARHLSKNRKTVDELLAAARKRIEQSRASERAAKQRAKLNPGNPN